jgi:hypothetical protein
MSKIVIVIANRGCLSNLGIKIVSLWSEHWTYIVASFMLIMVGVSKAGPAVVSE